MAYFDNVPLPPNPGGDEWILTAVHHIFGSEELSRYAPAVAGLVPTPYLAMHPQDAAELPAAAGDAVTIILGDLPQRLPIKLNSSLPRRVVALPVGLSELPFVNLPAIIRIVRRPDHD